MTPTAELLRSLEAVTHETVRMLAALDPAEPGQRETKRRVVELKEKAQQLFDLLATGTIPPERGYLDLVFDGPPDEETSRFLEAESPDGRSVRVGEWLERADGDWALRISPSDVT